MNPMILRAIGIIFILAAVVLSILNLKRVADLGVFWLFPILLVFGVLLVGLSRRAAR